MKIVNLIGGLGNQMFQYAFAIALKETYPNEQVLIDIEHFNKYPLHNGYELDKVFNISGIDIATKRQVNMVSWYIPYYKLSRLARKIFPARSTEYIEKKYYIYDPQAMIQKGDKYYEGYWFSPKYFDFCKDIIKHQFSIKDIDCKTDSLGKEMINCESVSIHIRRGDYMAAPDFKGICTLDYYKCAIEKVKKYDKKYKFYIFSNDIEWCKKHLYEVLNGFDVNFVEGNNGKNSYKDMFLMSCCHNMILANSSFSWWAAYLNRNETPNVYIPTKWVNFTNSMDISSKEWIRVTTIR